MKNDPVIVVKGEDKTIILRITEKITQDPIDLTNKEITGVVEGCPGRVELSTTSFNLINGPLGKVRVSFSDIDTAKFKKGAASFEVILTEGTDKKIVQFLNVLDVRERI